METVLIIYFVIGMWVYVETEEIASGILWPVWAFKQVWRD